jgi:FAD:protein FMN transferase
MSDISELPAAHLFSHEAMNTTFWLRLISPDAAFAAGVARECYELLDKIEDKLSRFREGSEIWRINRLRAGETLYLSDECHQCLLLAAAANTRSEGLFDVTIGSTIAHRKTGSNTETPAIIGSLLLHPEMPAITCGEAGRELDLGGIGKGFALDQLRNMLDDWGLAGGLLAAGNSTLLAFGDQPWPVELSGEHESRRVMLANAALSASGTGIQGEHIVDPRDPSRRLPWLRAWVITDSAAMADAFSTAVILMEDTEIAGFLTGETGVTGIYADDGTRIRIFRDFC